MSATTYVDVDYVGCCTYGGDQPLPSSWFEPEGDERWGPDVGWKRCSSNPSSFPRRRESSTLGVHGQAVATQCHLTHGGGYWIPAFAGMTVVRGVGPAPHHEVVTPASPSVSNTHRSSPSHLMRGPRLHAVVLATSLGPRIKCEDDE
jgi:hypothetical protein